MKTITIILLTVLALGVIGCNPTKQAIREFQMKNPGVTVFWVDEDADGTVDVAVYDFDGDGQADGEVPNTRTAISQAGQLDEMGADTMEIILGLFGLGAVGTTIAAWLRKMKLAKRAQYWLTACTEIVESVEYAKDQMSPKVREKTKADLTEFQEGSETETAVKICKGELAESAGPK